MNAQVMFPLKRALTYPLLITLLEAVIHKHGNVPIGKTMYRVSDENNGRTPSDCAKGCIELNDCVQIVSMCVYTMNLSGRPNVQA